MSITSITSSDHFRKVLSSSTYVVVDFYADWCGPCKTIAPIFQALATSESKPGRMTFCKVDVDSQQDISRTNGVTAMPTFLIFKSGTVSETIRGANPAALRSAVMSASKAASSASASGGASFTSSGRVLGGPATSTGTSGRAGLMATGDGFLSFASTEGLLGGFMRFVGLYFTTLFSLDPSAAAENSPFRFHLDWDIKAFPYLNRLPNSCDQHTLSYSHSITQDNQHVRRGSPPKGQARSTKPSRLQQLHFRPLNYKMQTRYLTYLTTTFSPLSASRTHLIPRLLLSRLPSTPIGATGLPLKITTTILPRGSKEPARCVIGFKGGEEVVFVDVSGHKGKGKMGAEEKEGGVLDLGKLKMNDVLEEVERRCRVIRRRESIAG